MHMHTLHTYLISYAKMQSTYIVDIFVKDLTPVSTQYTSTCI